MTNAYIERAGGFLQPRREARDAERINARIVSATEEERYRLRAISTAGEAAMMEILHIKRLQREAEQLASTRREIC